MVVMLDDFLLKFSCFGNSKINNSGEKGCKGYYYLTGMGGGGFTVEVLMSDKFDLHWRRQVWVDRLEKAAQLLEPSV